MTSDSAGNRSAPPQTVQTRLLQVRDTASRWFVLEQMGEIGMWRTHLLKTARGRFEVFELGEGPPLCATHLYSEFNASGDFFAESLAPYGTVYLVNLRGTGNSDPATQPEDLSMSAGVRDLEAIRRALGHAHWDFAGHSTGGMLGLHYAVTHAQALRSLIVVGASASHHYADTPRCIYHPEHPSFQRMQDLIIALKATDLTPKERSHLAAERIKLSLYQPERYAEHFRPEVTKRMSAPRLDYYAQVDFPQFDLRDRLRGCHVPTLALCGRHDVQCPPESSQEIAALMPRAQIELFEESNHYPFLEEGQAFASVVKRFLHDLAAPNV